MAVTKTCADLRENSKNYHENEERDDKKMQEIEYEMLYKEYPDVESFKKDLYKKIEIGLQQVKEGKYSPAEEFFKEMEEKYDLWKSTK